MNNKLYSNTSLRLLSHMHPHTRISPFIPTEWEKLLNSKINSSSSIVESPGFWLDGAKDMQFYKSGRDALLACLLFLKLKEMDEVLIVKNTNGPYITSCVTNTIEKACRWSHVPSHKTRLVLVIHEFGFPCPEERIKIFRNRGIPILEDCAYAFGSRTEGAKVGMLGDFALYSLPKYFPIPFGGALIANSKLGMRNVKLRISSDDKNILLKTIRSAYPYVKKWNRTRRDNWQFFAQKLTAYRFRPYFPLTQRAVPGVYLSAVSQNFAGEAVKKYLNAAGIESTQYYHQSGFYFPVHQFLTEYERQYIITAFVTCK